MKKYLFAILAAVIMLSGCEKLSELTQFTFPLSYEVDVPALQVTTYNYTKSFTLKPNMQSELTSRNLSSDLIETIVLQKASIELTSPASGDLSFLKSVEVFISEVGSTTETPLASALNIPDNIGKTLNLNVVNTDLKNLLLKDEIKITVKVATDKPTTELYKLKFGADFMVDLKVLGL